MGDFSAAALASSMASRDPATSTRRWEELRKDARKLESAVDHRLAAYSKLGTGFSLGGVSGMAGSQPPPDLAEVHRRASEIDGLLQQLAEVNEAMSACAAAGGSGGGSSELQSHTLARHSNILLEFSREFARTRAVVSANLERAQLLGVYGNTAGGTATGGSGSGDAGALSAEAAALKERASIHSALSSADDVISQAHATAASLAQQRGVLAGTFSKFTLFGAKIPTLNSLLLSIKRKKARDNLILSAIVVACTLFLFLYWINK